MSRSVVLCPHPPLLIRPLSGAADVAAELRAACLAAIGALLASGPPSVVVVGSGEPGEATGRWDEATPVDLRRFGTTGARTGPGLPLSLGVGRWLLDRAGWRGPTDLLLLDRDASGDDLEAVATELRARPDAGVLLLGEGSTRRGEKAPGFLDDRSFGFDEALAAALAAGDAAALAGLDAGLAAELMVSGRSVLRLLGRLAGAPDRYEVSYSDDPFGVSYLVATWEFSA